MADIGGESDEFLRTVELPRHSLKDEVVDTFEPVKQLLVVGDDAFEMYRGKTLFQKFLAALFWMFPILDWLSTYKPQYLIGDVIGGLTITSLAVPQDLAYAGLAGVPPINGLYSSFLPPLVYSVLGTSRHIAIGPTAVVSLLLGSLLQEYITDTADPTYLQLAFTATFFSGIVQLGMGVLRLGWVIDFLSHAAVVGFMAGAAVTIGLSQLKGLLGYSTFTNSTDIVSVLGYVFTHTYLFKWQAFVIGILWLAFFLLVKFLAWWFKGKKVLGKVFFFISALAPLISVIITTLCVYLTATSNQCCSSRWNCNYLDTSTNSVVKCTGGSPGKVPCVSPMPKGVSSLSSVNQLLLTGPWLGPAAAVGIIVGLISLTEAIAIARTFATMKGYHIDGNKEMIAYGAMNLAGCLTSGIATTGSFSRSSVNYNSGGNTMITNILMSIVVLIVLVCLTEVFIFLPSAVLSAIIIAAVITLIDLGAMWQIWKADKIDFLVMIGTFFGVIFASVEIGLLVGVCVSMFKILVLVTRPHLAVLGEIPGAAVYRNVKQYRYAKTMDGILALRVDAPIFFTNANYIRERVLSMAMRYEKDHEEPLTHVVLDFTPVPDLDTTGIHALEELYRCLKTMNVELGISNPSRIALRKLDASGFIEQIGRENLFLSVNEASKTFTMERISSKRVPSELQMHNETVDLESNGHQGNGTQSHGIEEHGNGIEINGRH